MSLNDYQKKRDLTKSPEPKAKKGSAKSQELKYVIQKHAARRLHYDFRLELDGVLKSWAVPKEPSLDPKKKRLAIEVEDHPLEYGSFEGVIPAGNYGAGTVEIWDYGTYLPLQGKTRHEQENSIKKQLEKGELKFILNGERLKGEYVLIRTHFGDKNNQWLLIKKNDEHSNAHAALEETDILPLKKKSKTHSLIK